MFTNWKIYLARFSFIVLLFVTFFGTGIPFRERIEDVEDFGSSNIINQGVYSFLFLSSFILLFTNKKKLTEFVLKEKYLTLFILWCLISIFWSPDSFVSFKRIFQIFTVILVCLSFLFYTESESDVLDFFKYIIYPYLFLSIIVVFIVPQAKDPQFGTWRGFTPHKNSLGAIGVITTVINYMLFTTARKKYSKYLAFVMLLISVVLVLGSFSSTSYSILGLLLAAWFIFSSDKFFKPIGVSRLVSTSSAILIVFIVAAVIFAIPDAKDFLPELFGKETSYSGRTDLWEYMLGEIAKHPVQGVGFQGYWIVDKLKYADIYDIFLWLPRQSHNGYLDILNEIGIVGMTLLILMIVFYFINYIKVRKPHVWALFIIIVMISNMSESSFFRLGEVMNLIFLFSYIYLFTSLIEKDTNKARGNSHRTIRNSRYARSELPRA